MKPGRYKIRVDKAGFTPYDQWVELGEGDKVLPVVLLRRGGGGPDRSRTWTEPVTGMEFVWVPEGCFQMGSNDGESDEKPVHRVCLDGYWLGKTEVTQGQWRKVMGTNPSFNEDCGEDCPVEEVSWEDAQGFIRKLNGRSGHTFKLPSEAQWEYACRSGGKDEKYAGGNSIDRVAWDWDNSGSETHRVGTKAPNGLGLYDMSGNVYEWVQDFYRKNAYGKHRGRNSIYTGGGSRGIERVGSNGVVRGGYWGSDAADARCANRINASPGNRNLNLGLRLLRTP